jgi:hypothetical protein
MLFFLSRVIPIPHAMNPKKKAPQNLNHYKLLVSHDNFIAENPIWMLAHLSKFKVGFKKKSIFS